MKEDEYKNKLAVRGQLSTADKLATLEYEMESLTEMIRTSSTTKEHWPSYMLVRGLEPPKPETTSPPVTPIPPATQAPPVEVPPV